MSQGAASAMVQARNSATPGVRCAGWRKAGTLYLPTGTDCEKNSGQSLIIPGENPPSTGTITSLKVWMRATISLLRNGFEQEAVHLWLSARARVPAGRQGPLWVKSHI
jgi:hypothetical protein